MFPESFFAITKTKLLLFFSAALGLGFIISMIMVIAYACQPKPSNEISVSAEVREKKLESAVRISELMFEDFPSKLGEAKLYLSRERMERWSDEQVKKYFIPPETILHEYFSKLNDNKIREIFEKIE